MEVAISPSPELIERIEAKVASGRYASTSEVMQEALGLLDRSESEQRRELRKAWQDGIDSGDAGLLDFDALRRAADQERAAGKGE